ncbi:MAG: UbiA prenyltransferase family protein [Myxococcota bacterium]
MSSVDSHAPAGSTALAELVRLARPKDWLKNVFVLMPLPFALASGASLDVPALAIGIAGMCLVSSAVYALNDVLDAERDRSSARNQRRPVASGRISSPTALVAGFVWLSAGLGLGQLSGHPGALVTLAAYAGLNLVYSLGLKHVPLLDAFILSAFYILRVVLGCVLVDVAPSNWLLLCSSALALLIALGKRRGELVRESGTAQRPALVGYNRVYLDQAMGIIAGVTVVSYALYSLETPLLVEGREFASLPFVVFGVLEYLRLAQVRDEGESPVDLLLRSPGLFAAGTGWVIASLWSVGLSNLLR